MVWKKALEVSPKIPSTERHGWQVCNCKQDCRVRCQCRNYSPECTDACSCVDICDNFSLDGKTDEDDELCESDSDGSGDLSILKNIYFCRTIFYKPE